MARIFSQTFGVVGAIIQRDGKIALVQEQAEGLPDHGKWSHPAGWLNVGEEPVIGAIREVEEETGFTFTPTAILRICSLVRKDIKEQCNGTPHAIKIIFVGEVDTDKQSTFHDDISDLKWFTPEEIFAMDNSTLRDIDIKQLVKDYFDGKRYPLDLIVHTIQNKK
ncbi:MAG: NUDIX domain-containing protein [bacterium]